MRSSMAVPFENRNFQKELEKKIDGFVREGKVPRLSLHDALPI